jgi:glucan phosphoethanolaminetransferase (alkaline phosphatase superfamily)
MYNVQELLWDKPVKQSILTLTLSTSQGSRARSGHRKLNVFQMFPDEGSSNWWLSNQIIFKA